ncbi:hypothetical protein [Dethiosulfatarculus sandiegensis]|uniref:hypothetical protein n=1 Tax=Dethiosulfatarculus sandiegensis TaxID=1429043 RepID=UPI0012E25C16|nr:hypothetical protein [Dethiosulfatarculus sandiegensis]
MRFLYAVVCFWLLITALPYPARAEIGSTKPEAIQKEIDRLRIHYTDEHPDIQRLLRHLEKARAQQEAEKARQEQREKLRNQGDEDSEN